MAANWFKFASPATFYPLAGKLIPWFAVAAAVLALVGLYIGLVAAPTDAQQGDAYRIIFIHVPAAWMSMFLYVVMAGWSAAALGLDSRTRMSVCGMVPPGRSRPRRHSWHWRICWMALRSRSCHPPTTFGCWAPTRHRSTSGCPMGE